MLSPYMFLQLKYLSGKTTKEERNKKQEMNIKNREGLE